MKLIQMRLIVPKVPSTQEVTCCRRYTYISTTYTHGKLFLCLFFGTFRRSTTTTTTTTTTTPTTTTT